MADLTTTYLGLHLKNPLVASASPLSKKVDRVRRLEEAGIAAVVMHSLFEEEITYESEELDYYLSRYTNHYYEHLDFYPELDTYHMGPGTYLEQLQKLKQAVDIPVIGSLNGASPGGWVKFAREIEQAGADALELNIYYVPTDMDTTSAELEESKLNLVRDVRAAVRIPIALKLSPFFTSFPNMARRFVDAGANALVLFNRFYQPDLDLETLEVEPNVELSTSHDLRLPLRWIALLYGRLETDFALTSGVHTEQDVLKAMMAGANVAMMTSELLAKGESRVPQLLAGIQQWMYENEYESIEQMRGSMSQRSVGESAAFERANYMQALGSLDRYLL